jgi:eukaryotic-like serine/threonine-protein kinase
VAAVGESYHQIIGRYALYDEIAAGGMASVHLGRLLGPVGFSRTVAIKRLHPQFAKDPEFVSMFVDEARVAARIRHPNVVPTLDVVKTEDELFLVMEYVQGESLARLLRWGRQSGRSMAVPTVVPVMAGVLHGLHAAHMAKGERGERLGIVHRDVSPQNVLVGTDGISRVFDFGIAKARGRLQTTRDGQLKGKLAYMAPEQLSGGDVGPRTDVYAAAVVLWEALANERLFDGDNEAMLLTRVLEGAKEPPSAYNPEVPPELDAIVMRGLSEWPSDRFDSARAMARELERSIECATPSEIGEWVEELATETLERRAGRVAEIESQSEVRAFAPDVSPSSAPFSAAPFSAATANPHTLGDGTLPSISVVGRRRDQRSKSWVMGLLALLLGGTLAVLFLRTPGTPAEPPPAPAPAAPPAPATSAAPTVAPPAASTAVPSATASARAAGPRPRPPPAPPAAPVAPVAPKKCEWKKVYDADGNHTYKEVCP